MAYDIQANLGDFTLERGDILKDDHVMGRVYGPEGTPLIIVMGGISASRYVADNENGGRGWWSTLVRPDGPVDTNKFRVLGYDFAPGVETDNRPDTITTRDQAKRLKALVDELGCESVAAIIGSSYGGMVGLAFAQAYPDAIQNLCIIGAAHKPHPIGVGWRGIQRRIVRLSLEAGQPNEGLKLARELAMTTYRTPEEFSYRFALNETAEKPSRFDICDYLGSRGDAYASIMDAERFLALSESIDIHRVSPEDIKTPTLLMSAISDQLAPLPDMGELRDRLSGPSELFTFTSLFGHDAFLKEYDMIGPRLDVFCEDLI